MVAEFVADYARMIVSSPEDISVDIKQSDDFAEITVYANQADVGKLIGKEGKMIGAIKTVISGCKAKDGLSYRINVEPKSQAKKLNTEKSTRFQVAKIGKAVGVHGEMKLHLKTDFPEQFVPGLCFNTKRGELVIESYTPERDLVKFKGYNSAENAKKLTNLELFVSEEQTREGIVLEEGQHFWFDIVESSVYEGDLLLGKVIEVERLGNTDYLKLETDKSLVSKKMPNSFLIPYLDNFVLEVDTDTKLIKVQGGFDILEAS